MYDAYTARWCVYVLAHSSCRHSILAGYDGVNSSQKLVQRAATSRDELRSSLARGRGARLYYAPKPSLRLLPSKSDTVAVPRKIGVCGWDLVWAGASDARYTDIEIYRKQIAVLFFNAQRAVCVSFIQE